MIAAMRKAMGNQSDLLLVLGLIGILMLLFVPIPGGLLDFLLVGF